MGSLEILGVIRAAVRTREDVIDLHVLKRDRLMANSADPLVTLPDLLTEWRSYHGMYSRMSPG